MLINSTSRKKRYNPKAYNRLHTKPPHLLKPPPSILQTAALPPSHPSSCIPPERRASRGTHQAYIHGIRHLQSPIPHSSSPPRNSAGERLSLGAEKGVRRQRRGSSSSSPRCGAAGGSAASGGGAGGCTDRVSLSLLCLSVSLAHARSQG